MKISKRELTEKEKEEILQKAQRIIDERYLFTKIKIEESDIEGIVRMVNKEKSTIKAIILTIRYPELFTRRWVTLNDKTNFKREKASQMSEDKRGNP